MNKLIYTLFLLSAITGLKAQRPSIGGYNVYYGHLHNHSYSSDGTGTPDYAYYYAKNTAGLDYFSLADHVGSIEPAEWDSVKAAAERYNEDSVFATFWGFEWSGSGHVTVTNTEDYPGISEDPAGTFTELCSWLDARNCIAIFNHPGRGTSMLFDGFASPPCDKFVGMELFNSTDDFSMHYYNDGFYPNDGNLNHYAEALMRGWRIGASGSDDNHAGTWGTRTDYRMAILSKHLSRPELFSALRARRIYSTLDKNLALSFKMDSSEMGSIIEGGDYTAQIRAGDADKEAFTRVMLFRNGFEIRAWDLDTAEVLITFPIRVFDGEFQYIKVTQADGDEAISSPIFITGGLVNARPLCSFTHPENGIHFTSPQWINLTAEASDSDGTVISVEFFVNGHSIGSDTLAPYTADYPIPENGIYELTAQAMDNFGYRTASSPRTVTVGNYSKTESSRITYAMDDMEERANGSIYTNSSDIELVFGGTNQTIGLRFTGMNVPPGAEIESAYIQFTVDEVSSGTCLLHIRGHNVDDSPPFSADSMDISGRATTSALVTWEPPNWPAVGAAGADQRTPDLSSIVQEIVNRPGYSLSSAVSFIITGTGKRTAEAYEGDAGAAALLVVDYSIGTGSPDAASASDESNLRVYPNPVSGGLVTVETEGGMVGNAWLTVTDITGRICHRTRIENSLTVLDVSQLKSGLYIIRLSNNDKFYSNKLMVK